VQWIHSFNEHRNFLLENKKPISNPPFDKYLNAIAVPIPVNNVFKTSIAKCKNTDFPPQKWTYCGLDEKYFFNQIPNKQFAAILTFWQSNKPRKVALNLE